MSALKDHIETVVEDLSGTCHAIVVATRAPSGLSKDRGHRPVGARRHPPTVTGHRPHRLYPPGRVRPAVAYAAFVGFSDFVTRRRTPQAAGVPVTDKFLARLIAARRRALWHKQRVFELLLVAAILTFFL